MGVFKANIQGLDKVLARIDSYNEALANGIDKELGTAAINIAVRARELVPKKTGRLAGSIGIDQSQTNQRIIGTALLYGAYVEFGTGENVFDAAFPFSDEQREFAKEFYVNGQGTLHSSPYLFPALEEETPKALQRIRRLLFGDL